MLTLQEICIRRIEDSKQLARKDQELRNMATYQIPPPEPMICSGNVAQNWKSFKEAFEDYVTATCLSEKDATVQAAALKSMMGKECREILQRLGLTDDEMKKPDVMLTKLSEHFSPARNILYERFLFHTAEQQTTESVDQYIIRLRKLAEGCEFKTLHEEMIRDRLVLGCIDKHARARLFREKECSLKSALEALRISEVTHEQLKRIGNEEDKEDVNAVGERSQRDRRPKKTLESGEEKKTDRSKQDYRKNGIDCAFCGEKHARRKCPAYGKTCGHCGRKNHYKKACFHRKNNAHRIEDAEQSDETEETTGLYNVVETISQMKHRYSQEFLVKLKFKEGGRKVNMHCQIDTGATCNVMSFTDLCSLKQSSKPVMRPSKSKLRFYDNSTVKVLGEVELICDTKTGKKLLNFKIVRSTQMPLLSGRTCSELGLITVNRVNRVNADNSSSDLIEEFSDVFEGLGCLEGEYHIDTDPDVPPVQHAPRRVPVPMKAKLKAKIKELEQQGVIKKVNTPTEWISSLVAIVKPNKLRICIDPKDLNKAIRRPKYQMPVLDEVLPKLSNAKIFTVLDAKDGFHQVRLDEASSYLTTFWTPFGRYRYCRLPFGISSAPEEYQRRMHDVLDGLEGVEVIADDILVYGCGTTEEEYIRDHDIKLRALLERARERNLKLNKKKLKLRLQEVPYMGHLLTNKGMLPDPTKIQAVQEMKRPENKKAVQRLLGVVNYLSRYLPKLSDAAEPLRRLTEKESIFHWQSQQEDSFCTVKKLVTSSPILKFYDVNEEVTVQADASEKGLGATLLQNGQPVAFISRALTKTEQTYAQIEKECLAIVFACERFNHYIHGRDLVTVQTDHNPLVPIFKKPLLSAPKRLQRMLLRLQKYNVKLEYLQGSKMYIADMLSRAFLRNDTNRQLPEYQIFQLKEESAFFKGIEQINQADHVNVSRGTEEAIRSETKKDEMLQALTNHTLKGWPEHRDEVPESVRSCWPFRDEINVQNGIVFKGMRMIVPLALRKKMMKRAHDSHQGAEASIRRAQDVIFWPGMAKEIRELVSQCNVCNSYLSKQQKEPLMTHKIPSRPWQMIGQDIFTLQRKNYLITVDYYSDFWEVNELVGGGSEEVVKCTKDHFARHGIPDSVITDNGPHFRGAEYDKFAKEWEFQHVTSSPYHSQSNGKAESAVKIAKTLMKKASNASDVQLAILNWRNTPSEGSRYSPVQKLQSRRTKSLLPATDAMLQPKIAQGVQEEITQKRKQAKTYYDRGAKPLPELEIGQPVRMQPILKGAKWEKAVTVQQVGNRSYLVETENGKRYRRNRRFLRTTDENISDTPTSEDQVAKPQENTESDEIDTTDPQDAVIQPAPDVLEPTELAPEPTPVVQPPTSPAPVPNAAPVVDPAPVRRSSRGRKIPAKLKDYKIYK